MTAMVQVQKFRQGEASRSPQVPIRFEVTAQLEASG